MAAFCVIPTDFVRDMISSSLWAILFSRIPLLFKPGPINDHCPIPKFFATTLTTLAFAEHSSLLTFVPQEMSLHIDMNRILPVKYSGFLREDEVTWYCEQHTASPPEWARVYCGLRPGPTRVMPPSRQDEEGHQSASSYVHCLCWRTCCCTWMCVLAVLLLLIGLVCPHSSSPDS